MKKNYLLFATAAIVLAGCTADDDLSAGKSTSPAQGDGAIMFSMNTPATTRANQLSGDNAATALGNMFIVWGEKNEGVTPATGETKVFENYVVKYEQAKTNTTISNTDGWEYVGFTPYNENLVSPSINGTNTSDLKTQTIKYWDTSAENYVFTAVSAPSAQITDGRVKIEKDATNSDIFQKGYTITFKQNSSAQNADKDATPDNVFVSDRKVIEKANIATAKDKAVTLTFRNFMSKVRFGIYENIPGYNVVITKVSANNVDYTSQTSTDDKFGVTGKFIIPSDGSTNSQYKVTYESQGDETTGNKNKAKVAVVGTPATKSYLTTKGGNWFTKTFNTSTLNGGISETTADPTYDQADGAYTTIMPCDAATSIAGDMTLTIDYDLYSVDTGEKISVTNKTAVVPAAYCQWKSNYAYTYIFKITDKSAELFPITFDAVVETADNGIQETITTVSGGTEPKFTTMGVKGNKITEKKNEYENGSDIYASVMDYTTNSKYEEVTLSNANANLYKVEATNTTISEAAVANCLTQTKYNTGYTPTTAKTYPITDLNGGTLTVTELTETTDYSFVAEVPTEEGLASAKRALSALKWTGTSTSGTTYYAVEYKKTVDNKDVKYYKIVKVVNQ